MTRFPGESNTRNNLLAYKYTGKKSIDFRSPRGLEVGSQRWNCTLGHVFEVLFVRSTNSAKFCSFVLRTLRCSIRLLNKNERLSLNWTWLWSERST